MHGLHIAFVVLVVAVSNASGFFLRKETDPFCPGSPALIHAKVSVLSTLASSCADVKEEISLRVNGQWDAWHDPHNNGTYTLVDKSDSAFALTRLTGNKKYTDKIKFTFTDTEKGCQLNACSESQVMSVLDFGTNYCNIIMLYCGRDIGCLPVKHDFKVVDAQVSKSSGAEANFQTCMML